MKLETYRIILTLCAITATFFIALTADFTMKEYYMKRLYLDPPTCIPTPDVDNMKRKV